MSCLNVLQRHMTLEDDALKPRMIIPIVTMFPKLTSKRWRKVKAEDDGQYTMWVWLLLAQVALVSPQNTTNWSSAHHTGDAASEQRVHGSGTTSSLCMPSSISNVYILCLLVTLVKETSQLRLKGFIYTKSYTDTILYLIIVKLILYTFFFSLTIFRFRVFHTGHLFATLPKIWSHLTVQVG